MGVHEAPDRELVRRIGRGELQALGDLYDRQAPLLALRLRRGGASIEEAEDVIQETFLDVWKGAGSYRGDSTVAAWLWGIAWRKLSMLVRAEIRLRRRQERASHRPVSAEPDWASGFDARDAVEHLDHDLRAAFLAVAVEGLSIVDASTRLGVPEGTVKSRVHRARRILTKELQ